MKGLICWICALVLLFSLVSCVGNKNEKDQDNTSGSVTIEEATTEKPLQKMEADTSEGFGDLILPN